MYNSTASRANRIESPGISPNGNPHLKIEHGMHHSILYRFNLPNPWFFSMFSHHTMTRYKESLHGIQQKILVFGDHTLVIEFRLDKGSNLPAHIHPHEQTGYLVFGYLTLRVGAEQSEIWPGDSWNIPGNVEHSATIHQDSVAVEIFSPVRKEYLP